MDRLSPSFRTFLLALAVLVLMLGAIVNRADAQTVTPTREGTADWLCCDDSACSVSTGHQRQDTAFAACVNRSFIDGKTRWLVPARYRIAVTMPTPAPAPTSKLTWTAPAKNTDGTLISQPLTYRVEAQANGAWSALATVNSTSYDAPGTSGCWRVVAIAGGVESVPTGAACR